MSAWNTAQYGSRRLMGVGFRGSGASMRPSSIADYGLRIAENYLGPNHDDGGFESAFRNPQWIRSGGLVHLIGPGEAARFLFLHQVQERLLGLLTDTADADQRYL